MATYRLSVSTISRSSKRSAIAAAAYRAAERLVEARDQGLTHDYRNRGADIVHTGIFAPSDAPEWAHDRGALWNAAEAAETRKNSVTARELQLSLPHELTDEARVQLVEAYARDLVGRYGVAVDLAIHRPDKKGDARNHHAHVMMTTRRLTAQGFIEKTRELDDRSKPEDGERSRGSQEVEWMRVAWEERCNDALARANVPERVDHRSYERQGIALEPEPRLGHKAHAMEQKGQLTLKGQWREAVRRRDLDAADRGAMNYAKRQRAEKADWYPTLPRPAMRPAGGLRSHTSGRTERERLDRQAAKLAARQRPTPAGSEPRDQAIGPERAFTPMAAPSSTAPAQPAATRPVIQQPAPPADVFARDPAKDLWAAHYKQCRQELAKLASTHALERAQMLERHRLAERKAAAPKVDRRRGLSKLFAKLSGEEEQRQRREAKERIEAQQRRAAELEQQAKRQQAERAELEARHAAERQRLGREVRKTKKDEQLLVQTFQRRAALEQERPKQELKRKRHRPRSGARSLAKERRELRPKKPQGAEP